MSASVNAAARTAAARSGTAASASSSHRACRTAARAAPRSATAAAPVMRLNTKRKPCLRRLRHAGIDGRRARRSAASARSAGRSPRDRGGSSGSARAACRCARRAPPGCCRTVLAVAVAAVEVVARRAGRDVDDAELLVDRHLAPVVHAAVVAEALLGPACRRRIRRRAARCGRSTRARRCARCRHGCRPVPTRRTAAAGRQRHDDRVLEDAAGVAGLQRADRRDVAVEPDAQVDAAVVAEGRDRLARLRVDGREVPGVEVQQPLVRCRRRCASSSCRACRRRLRWREPRARGPSRRRARRSSGPSRARTSCCRRRAD